MTRSFLFLSILCLRLTVSASCNDTDPANDKDRIKDASHCLPQFHENEEDYVDCKRRICYLFIHQPPFIQTSQNFTKANHIAFQKPFDCRNHAEVDHDLMGLSFDIFRSLKPGHLCIWAGHESKCRFNALVDFVDLQAIHGYQFAVGNLLVELPRRACRLRYGHGIFSEKIVILGRVDASAGFTASSAFGQLLAPFQWKTWCLFGGGIVILATFAMLHVMIIYPRRVVSIRRAFLLLIGADGIAAGDIELPPPQWNPNRLNIRVISRFLYISVLSLFGIFLVFYEIGVVNFLFQTRNSELGKRITDLSRQELANYCAISNSGSEAVWGSYRKYSDPARKPILVRTHGSCDSFVNHLQTDTDNFSFFPRQ